MPNHSNHNRFFINDFDNDDMDELLANLIDAVFAEGQTNLEFWINSEGGDAKRAFAIVELIELAKLHGLLVETFVLCDAYSAGSIVAVAGSDGHRYTARNASYFIHYGTAKQRADSPAEAEVIAQANIRYFDKIGNHYKKYCKVPHLKNMLENGGYWFTGVEAVQMGVADAFLEDYS